jgi:hypothetical protein
MLTGKIICTNKQLESHDIPTDRFFKRMTVYIFRTIDKRKIPMKYAIKLCTCHDKFYYCGDCEDDEMPYFIPCEWVKLNK